MAAACPCGYRYECPCGCQSCPRCDGPEPDRSRVAGAIGRGLTDAREAYRASLVAMWHEAGAELNTTTVQP